MEIIVLAVIAGAILFKLFSVLGQKTGEEGRQPTGLERRRSAEAADDANVVPMPGRAAQPASVNVGPSAQGLTELQIADRSFEPEAFLAGAKGAYGM
ncbi:MAG: Tim44 domain-containing protein, partial [Pseudomonadota bacterium]